MTTLNPLSFIRTYVPLGIGVLLTWVAAQTHIVIDPGTEVALGGVCVAVLSAAYYALVRLLEARFPWMSVFLGSPAGTKPVYTNSDDGTPLGLDDSGTGAGVLQGLDQPA